VSPARPSRAAGGPATRTRRLAPRRRRLAALLAAVAVALLCAGAASAHARISPPVSLSDTLQLYSLAVPTEQADATTREIVLSVPAGFSIDSFVPSPGWRRTVARTVLASGVVVEKVTWSGGAVPSGEDALFEFLGEASSIGTYSFEVEQTYSNGSIVDWVGPESSAAPAPTIQVKRSLGGAGTPLLTIVALVVGVLGVLIGGIALLTGAGKRQLA
jgi:uncharacterized protein YcnI